MPAYENQVHLLYLAVNVEFCGNCDDLIMMHYEIEY